MPKAMDATTQRETAIVKAGKGHGLILLVGVRQDSMLPVHTNKEVLMANQQPNLFEGSKVCKVCKETKEIDEYRLVRNKYRDRRDRVYRHSMCIPCEQNYNHSLFRTNYDREKSNARMKQWRADNPELARAHGRKWGKVVRDQQRAKVYAAYGNKCQCCEETEPLFLTIDHVNNDGHLERKAHSQGGLYSRIIQENFPDRYQILCWNCNAGKKRNNGVCPHQGGSTVIAQASSSKRSEAPGSLAIHQG